MASRSAKTARLGSPRKTFETTPATTHSFTSLGGYQATGIELSGVGNPATVIAIRMTAGVFPTLGVQPLLGRVFTQQEDDHHQQVLVLSYAAWQSRFQGDKDILGKKVFLDREPYLVIGVMPRNFEFPLYPGHLNHSELWVPMSFTAQETSLNGYTSDWEFAMVGRLKPGVTPAHAAMDAGHVAEETMRGYPPFLAGFSIRAVVRPLSEEVVEQARPLLRILFLAAIVVLLIACANLAGLLLVRAIRQRREIALRLALGASSATLLWQAILESLLLSVAGGLLGLVLAAGVLRVGISLLPETLPRINEIGLDWPVAGFALGLTLLTGLICGLASAFAALRTSVNHALKEGGRTGTSGAGHVRMRSALVITEIAVALILLAASGLLLRSFEKHASRRPRLSARPYAGRFLCLARDALSYPSLGRRIQPRAAAQAAANCLGQKAWGLLPVCPTQGTPATTRLLPRATFRQRMRAWISAHPF